MAKPLSHSTFASIGDRLCPEGILVNDDPFGIEWLNAPHAIIEAVAMQGYVSRLEPPRFTGFEVAVMPPEVRSQLAHLDLPGQHEEQEAFDGHLKFLELELRHQASWESALETIRAHQHYLWPVPFEGHRRAYTFADDIFTIWRFRPEGFESLTICHIPTVREIQLLGGAVSNEAGLPLETFGQMIDFFSETVAEIEETSE